MRILLTGAFGNIGESTLNKLLKQGHQVRCFDRKNSKTKRVKKRLSEKGYFETYWGDITNLDEIDKAVYNQDCIIHLAAIVPPLSETNPDLAYKVNVGGTKNLIEAAKKLNKPPKLIIASSVAVYGPKMNCEPPRCIDEPLHPIDNYSHHKVEIEKLVRESGLSWLILRLSAVGSLKFPLTIDPILYEVPLSQRIELIYTKDAGSAFANAVTTDIKNRIFLIGGGKSCQIYQRTYAEKMFEIMGISMPPDSAFKIPKKDSDWFYTDWMDTEESQKLLNYQRKSFKDYIEKLRKIYRKRRIFTRLASPIIKLLLLSKSPYYKT